MKVEVTPVSSPDETIRLVGAKRYVTILWLFFATSLAALYEIYVRGEKPTFLIFGIFPSTLLFSFLILFCIVHQAVYKNMNYSFRIFLVGSLIVSLVVLGFGKGKLGNPILVLLPILVMLISWVWSRKVAYVSAALVCTIVGLLCVDSVFINPAPQIIYQPKIYFYVFIAAVAASAVFGGVISDSNDRQLKLLDQKVLERTQLLEESKRSLHLRTAESEESAKELKAILVQVEENNAQLAQAKTMASIVQLSSGFAEKLGGPTGTNVLTLSTLQSATKEFTARVQGNKLKRSDLDDFLASMQTGLQIVSTSSSAIALLIENFKRISKTDDQMWSTFSLKEMMSDAIGVLDKKAKKTETWNTEIILKEDISATSCYGYLRDVLVEVMENACNHGGSSGTIVIDASLEKDTVTIIVSDNGSGIQKVYHEKIFEPFFTLHPGRGSLGLGLYVAYLFMSRIGGSISVREQKKGTCIAISFPQNVMN